MKKAARRIVEKLRLHGHEAFFAGGWVRDFLLRRKPKDIDIATSARPDEVLRLFPNARTIGAQFGVVQVLLYGSTYEVATFRSDNAYHDGRHPASITFSGPEQDALRRDFTINGLFYDPVADRIIDYVHGKGDLQNKLIRTIGDPLERFAEDKLRMLRAIRFSCGLRFHIVPQTWEALRQLAPEIRQVSWERIRDELILLVTGPVPDVGLDLLHESGLLAHILPEVEALRGVPQSTALTPGMDVFEHTRSAVSLLRKPSGVLAIAALLHDTGKAATGLDDHAQAGGKIAEEVCRRLRMSNEEIDRIVGMVAAHTDFMKADEMGEGSLRRLLGKADIKDHLELFRVNCVSGKGSLESYSKCRQMLEEFARNPVGPPIISGKDLIEMGYSPGPVFKEILRRVEDLQLEGKLHTREQALQYIRAAFPMEGNTLP